jgi:hypothetical protein
MKTQAKITKRAVNKDEHQDELFTILNQFEKRKPTILATLRAAHQQGPSTQPFDEKGASDALKFFLCHYFGHVIARKQARPSPDIRERFNKLAVDMEQVRRALGELLDSSELKYVVNGGQRIGAEVIQDICTSIDGLAALGAAVREACQDIPLKSGRPHARVLWPAGVEHLAELYAKSTGRKPGSGMGPFARFVYAVLSALGQNVSEDYVIDVIKGAHLARAKSRPGVRSPSKGD